jgi:predicted DsbA family dithiol-disulfide isomerase
VSLYKGLNNLLIALVQISNEMGLKIKNFKNLVTSSEKHDAGKSEIKTLFKN